MLKPSILWLKIQECEMCMHDKLIYTYHKEEGETVKRVSSCKRGIKRSNVQWFGQNELI